MNTQSSMMLDVAYTFDDGLELLANKEKEDRSWDCHAEEILEEVKFKAHKNSKED